MLPLDSRGTMRFADERPQLTADRQMYTYYPGTQTVPENVAANVLNRAHSITADVEIPKGGAEGVIVCHGSNVGGYTLFVKDRKLHYVHNYVGAEEFHVESNAAVPDGKVRLRYRVRADRQARSGEGQGFAGKGPALHQRQARGRVVTAVHRAACLGLGSGVAVGRNPGSTISALYQPPFEFTGTIHSVTVDVSGKLLLDPKEQEAACLGRSRWHGSGN